MKRTRKVEREIAWCYRQRERQVRGLEPLAPEPQPEGEATGDETTDEQRAAVRADTV